jgi:hypothetical protein
MAARHAAVAPRGICHHERTACPAATAHGHHYRLQHPRRRRGDGAEQLGRLSGDNAVSLVVYDGLPQDSIVDTDVASVIQSTRQGVGKQIADMVRQLINGDDIAQLQVLWQPEFSPARRPEYLHFLNPITNPKRFGLYPKRFGSNSGIP